MSSVLARDTEAMRRAALSLLLLTSLLGTPPTAAAEDSGPRLTCLQHSLRVMAAEASGTRLVCTIDGVDSAEQAFTIVAHDDAVQPPRERTICSATLSAGSGWCLGAVFDLDGGEPSPMHFTATLLPSGTELAEPPPSD